MVRIAVGTRCRFAAARRVGWSPLGRMTGAVTRHMRATYAYDALGRHTRAQVTPLAMAGSGWRDAERARLAREHGYGLTLYGWDGDRLAYETMKARREIAHSVYVPDSFTPLARMSMPMGRPEDGLGGISANRQLCLVEFYGDPICHLNSPDKQALGR